MLRSGLYCSLIMANAAAFLVGSSYLLFGAQFLYSSSSSLSTTSERSSPITTLASAPGQQAASSRTKARTRDITAGTASTGCCKEGGLFKANGLLSNLLLLSNRWDLLASSHRPGRGGNPLVAGYPTHKARPVLEAHGEDGFERAKKRTRPKRGTPFGGLQGKRVKSALRVASHLCQIGSIVKPSGGRAVR